MVAGDSAVMSEEWASGLGSCLVQAQVGGLGASRYPEHVEAPEGSSNHKGSHHRPLLPAL